MQLTPEQQSVLQGSEGPVMARCLQTLVRYGEAFDAPRLVPIKSAHLTGSFKIFFYTAYYEIVRQLVDAGIRVKVPTTLNPRPGFDFKIQNRIIFKKQKWHEAQLEALGVTPNYSCVCYQHANVPEFGDILGWAESSAIIFANSVIGARSNRNSIMVDICQAVTGLTPEFGYLLDENRKGQVMVNLDIEKMDAPALGFLIGKIAVDRVPVLSHYPFDWNELKNMGAAMASSGGVTLFHVLGLTPEAPDMETAFGGREPEETVTITQADLESICASDAERNESAIVAFGCPQMTLEETIEIAERFVGKKVKKPVLFHLLPEAADAFADTPLYQEVLNAGVEIHAHCPLAGMSLRIGRKTDVLTPSGKLYYYLEGTKYASVDEVLAAAGVLD